MYNNSRHVPYLSRTA